MRGIPDPQLQPTLLTLDYTPIVPVPTRRRSIDARFADFHAANPHVYRNIRALALSLVDAGREKVGVKACIEVLRYFVGIHTERGSDPYALNNDYASRYARLLLKDEPRLRGLIDTRERTSR